MGYFEDFMGKLDPKTAKRIKTAAETSVTKYELASPGLNYALSGGIAAGRITLIYGNTSAGKSLLMMESIAGWQKKGLSCAYVDAEGTYDKTFAAKLGVNNEELILIQKKSFGAVFDTIVPLLQQEINIIVIDSISDMLPEVFVDDNGNVNEFSKMKQMGAHAKSTAIFVNGVHYENKSTAVIVLSQTTTDLSQTYARQIPHGGQKLLFGSSQIIKLTSSGTEKNQKMGSVYSGDNILQLPVARDVDYYIEKNKLGPQSRRGTYTMYYAGASIGIDTIKELVGLGEQFGIIVKSGSWYKYDGESYQGDDNFALALKSNKELHDKLKAEVYLVIRGGVIE